MGEYDVTDKRVDAAPQHDERGYAPDVVVREPVDGGGLVRDQCEENRAYHGQKGRGAQDQRILRTGNDAQVGGVEYAASRAVVGTQAVVRPDGTDPAVAAGIITGWSQNHDEAYQEPERTAELRARYAASVAQAQRNRVEKQDEEVGKVTHGTTLLAGDSYIVLAKSIPEQLHSLFDPSQYPDGIIKTEFNSTNAHGGRDEADNDRDHRGLAFRISGADGRPLQDFLLNSGGHGTAFVAPTPRIAMAAQQVASIEGLGNLLSKVDALAGLVNAFEHDPLVGRKLVLPHGACGIGHQSDGRASQGRRR